MSKRIQRSTKGRLVLAFIISPSLLIPLQAQQQPRTSHDTGDNKSNEKSKNAKSQSRNTVGYDFNEGAEQSDYVVKEYVVTRRGIDSIYIKEGIQLTLTFEQPQYSGNPITTFLKIVNGSKRYIYVAGAGYGLFNNGVVAPGEKQLRPIMVYLSKGDYVKKTEVTLMYIPKERIPVAEAERAEAKKRMAEYSREIDRFYGTPSHRRETAKPSSGQDKAGSSSIRNAEAERAQSDVRWAIQKVERADKRVAETDADVKKWQRLIDNTKDSIMVAAYRVNLSISQRAATDAKSKAADARIELQRAKRKLEEM